MHLGNEEVASRCFQRAMGIHEHHGVTGSIQHLILLGCLASTAANPSDSLQYFEAALAIQRRVFPPDHPDIAVTLRNIGICKSSAGLNDEVGSLAAKSAALRVVRRSQTACAGPGCKLGLRPDGAPLDVCNNCKRTFYCGKACQTADWKAGHKAECKELVAEGHAVLYGSA